MEYCLWITNINNCNGSKQLKIVTFIGITIYILFLMNLFLITFFKYKNNKIKLLNINKYRFFEYISILLIILLLIRIAYFILLIVNYIEKLWVLTLLQEIYWGISLYILISIFLILIKFIPNFDIQRCNKIFIIALLLYPINIYLAINSGLLMQSKHFDKAFMLIGYQFLIYSIYWIILGTLYIIYFRKFIIIFNNYKNTENHAFFIFLHNKIRPFKYSIYCLICCFYVFSPLWFMQSVILWIDPLYYKKNINLQIFISIFWYFGGDSFFIIFFIYYFINW